MHPAEIRIDAVVINRQAGPGPDQHVRLVMLERRRQLQRGKRTHIPFGNASFGSVGPRDFLFVVAAVDMLH